MEIVGWETMTATEIATLAEQMMREAEAQALNEIHDTFTEWGRTVDRVVLAREFSDGNERWTISHGTLKDDDWFEHFAEIEEITAGLETTITLAVQPIVRTVREDDLENIHLTIVEGQPRLTASRVYQD